MGRALREDQLLSFEEFDAFYGSRPDGERWELIEGRALMQASPTNRHQAIVGNVYLLLQEHARRDRASWRAYPGFAVRLASLGRNTPTPDLLVRPLPVTAAHVCSDPILVVEVLSRGTRRIDLGVKREFYQKVDSIAHYLVVSQDEVRARLWSRGDAWREHTFCRFDEFVPLKALGVELLMRDIYDLTGLAEAE